MSEQLQRRAGWIVRWGALMLSLVVLLLPVTGFAQDTGRSESVDIFLEDEKLDVEADIPSVELVLSFKGLRYETLELKKTFLPELFKTVEKDPF